MLTPPGVQPFVFRATNIDGVMDCALSDAENAQLSPTGPPANIWEHEWSKLLEWSKDQKPLDVTY